MTAFSPDTPAPARASAVRRFGRLQLLRLLGKSDRTMAWRVADPRTGQELMLVLPRVQPADAAALEHWHLSMRQATRLNHPQLAAVVESGVQDGWPFVAYDPRDCATLAERASAKGLPGAEAAALALQVLHGLAFAHEAGVAHHDLQPYLVLVSDSGQVRVAGAGVAAEMNAGTAEGTTAGTAAGTAAGTVAKTAARPAPQGSGRRTAATTESMTLSSHRQAAERDVLALGLLLHGLLAGSSAFDDVDLGRIILRLPPYSGHTGRDFVRLPWSLAHPVPDPLRAIVNRATDRQERIRYRSARTVLQALEGWLQTDAANEAGPMALLADRLRTAGVLPSSPGAAARAARLALMERQRTNELAEVVLEDLALSFEMLRLVNTAQVRGAQVAGSGPVLTVRRAIAMLGLDGVRRAALALREWPGPLQEGGARQLQTLIDRCKCAGRAAIALRPAGYDSEVVYLITLLQNLGRLVVQYHFADEAQQIRRLMKTAPSARQGEADDPGMSEEAAAYAVLGADIEAIGAAVARHWGLDDSVLVMARRLPLTTPVRNAEADDDLLRTLASCANEAVDALDETAARVAPALLRVVQRYGRVLGVNQRDLQAALQGKSPAAGAPISATAHAPLEAATAHAPLEEIAQPSVGATP